MQKYKCSICGYIFDESAGVPKKGIAPGTKWEDVPDTFVCPLCNAPKSMFKLIEEIKSNPVDSKESIHIEDLKELSAGEISVICSNLAKGCEKQRLLAEMEAFNKIADYFKSKAVKEKDKTLEDAAKMLEDDLTNGLPTANAAAKKEKDRGAQRSLVWSEKVSLMMKSLLQRFSGEGDAILSNNKVFVCDICGFIYIGDKPPELCPVCKVQSFKILQVERR